MNTQLLGQELKARGTDFPTLCGQFGISPKQAAAALEGKMWLPPSVLRDLREAVGLPS